MLHLTGRTDLILHCHTLAPTSVIRRAFVTGTVEVLGLFNPISPSAPHPGWVIRVTTCNGTEYALALVPDFLRHYLVQLDEIRWEHWQGGYIAFRSSILTSGDNPKEYRRLRDAAIAARGSS